MTTTNLTACTVTDDDIRTLHADCEGDRWWQSICDRAIGGNLAERNRCARAINAARSMDADNAGLQADA